MPTGYTAKLVEDGQKFPEFVLTCARAFGALISLRDEPLEPVPEGFEPSSSGTTYHLDGITRAKDLLAKLKAMTFEEQQTYGEAIRLAELKNTRSYMEKCEAENERVNTMIAEVTAWEPPSSEHVQLKEFMLSQLKVSLNDGSYYTKQLAATEASTPQKFYDAALEGAKHDIDYHEKHLLEDNERTKGASVWVKQLQDSLRAYSGR